MKPHESHHLAVKAYDVGTRVRLSGRLEKVGRMWVLRNPAAFRVEQ